MELKNIPEYPQLYESPQGWLYYIDENGDEIYS